MSGLDLLAEVKEKYPSMPVLLMTGHEAKYTATEVLSAGADGYITKPFKNTEILNKLRVFLD